MESSKALDVVAKRVGHGVSSPNQIIIDFGSAGGAKTATAIEARTRLTQAITESSETYVIATDDKAPFIDSSGRYLRIYVIGHHDLGAEVSQKL
ncbi:MAG: hypothetical protein WDO06_02490 [Actinomycetota bacterium]